MRQPLSSRIFDFLVFLLILFPLFGGGFWIQKTHLKLELVELAVPVIVVFFFALLLRPRESWMTRTARKGFERWRIFLGGRPALALGCGASIFALLWAGSSLRRHWALQSNAFDLGIFVNAIWNLTHGNGYLSSVKGGINLFSDHQSPVFWLLAPLFRIFPAPETLLISQAVGLSLGAAAVYRLGLQYRKTASPPFFMAALPLLYWAYLPIRQANAFDFHPEVFMLPLFLWAIVGIQSARRWEKAAGWISFALALGCKESAGPIAVGIGLAWITGAAPEGRRNLRGIIAMISGLAVFVFDVKAVPELFGHGYAYSQSYHHLWLGPLEWLRSFLGLSRIRFFLATLAPLGFLPFLAPRPLLAAAPAYAMLFLAEGDLRVSSQFHYGIEPAIGLFWALAASGERITSSRLFSRIPAGVWICFWALFSFGRSEMYWIRRFEPTEHALWVRKQLVPCLRADVSLSANSSLVPQVATRRWIQEIPDLENPAGLNDCVWIDHSMNAWPLGSEDLSRWEQSAPLLSGYRISFECGVTRLYQRRDFGESCLQCEPKCP